MDPTKKIGEFFVGVFGSRNERLIESMLETVEEINRLEPVMQKLSDKALCAKTQEFRNRLADAFHGRDFTREEADRELNVILSRRRSRSCARRAGAWSTRRTSQNPQPMRHFDVQLVGGMVLHRGCIAEMSTGEGKTLVATLAAYLNALLGRGVHIVTVNDYLARRDREWMGPLYEFLGLTAGVILHQQEYGPKRAGLHLRHHLRHVQRVRLRLPARQHALERRGAGAAPRAVLRDRGRGGQYPD